MAKNSPAVPEQPSAMKSLFAGMVHTEENSDPEAIAVAMVERVMAAENLDDILGNAGDVTHAEDLIDQDLMITGLQSFNESDFADGPGVYAVVIGHTFKNPDEQLTITCGSATVCAQLYRLNELRLWPVACRFERAKKATKAGYFPLQLRKVDAKKYERFPDE